MPSRSGSTMTSSGSRLLLSLTLANLLLFLLQTLAAGAQQHDREPVLSERQAGLQAPGEDEYLVGVGIADITGPSADINLMGYAKPNQDAGGIHLRQFCRAVVMEDRHGTRLAYLNLDNGMISQLLRTQLMKRLRDEFGERTYNESNVMLSATHTHSGPGGYFQYMLYNIPSAGYISQTLEALLEGVVRSLARAHERMQPARVFFAKGELTEASINRSPTSYANNPADERARFTHDTDKGMYLLRFVDRQNRPIAMMNWFAVHGTSMNISNHLISSDNKGYAALLFEEEINGKGSLPGQGQFVAVFAQANEGDVSPNTRGPRCIDTGLPCDDATSTCGNPPRNEKCIASGPGRDMFESTKIIAYKQYNKARQLFLDTANQRQVRGPLRYVHEYIDITKQEVALYPSVVNLAKRHGQAAAAAAAADSAAGGAQPQASPAKQSARRRASGGPSVALWARRRSDQGGEAAPGPDPLGGNPNYHLATKIVPAYALNATYQTCVAALGYSFAAGTTDGPGAFDFQQGDTASSRYWNMVRNFLRRPSEEQTKCHHPKPILLSTGEMDFPYMWHPKVVPTQIFMIGQVAIVGLPGEFTTMSGRRVRQAVEAALNSNGQAQEPSSNAYDLASDEARLRQLMRASQRNNNNNNGQQAVAQPLPGGANSKSSTMKKRSTSGGAGGPYEVVLSGLSNIYTSYITTIEEYEMQRYEGASTLYGPHTLQAYVNQFVRLARVLATSPPTSSHELTPAGLQPPDLTKSLFTLKAGVIYDGAPHGKNFGDLLKDVEPKRVYKCRELVSVAFVAGNPRNDLKQEGSFLYVDKFQSKDSSWQVVANDASWETKFIWERTNTIFGESKATIEWEIPDACETGVYRVRHLGAHKSLILQTVSQYAGKSSPFKVVGGGGGIASGSFNASEAALALEASLKLAEQLEAQSPEDQLAAASKQQQKNSGGGLLAANPKSDRRLTPSSLLASVAHYLGSLFYLRNRST